MSAINKDSIQALRRKFKDDSDVMDLLNDCFNSFLEYGNRIYQLEIFRLLFNYDNTDVENYRQELSTLDQSRTAAHNAVIANLGVVNRLCEQNGILLIYDGLLSKERPYRVEVADAVLAYVTEVIDARVK